MTPPLAIALELPRSLAGAVVFAVIVLTATYAILTAFVRIQTTRVPSVADRGDEIRATIEEDDRGGEPAVAAYPSPEPMPATDPLPTPEPMVIVDAVRIRNIRISVGDPAALAMQAVRRNESTAMPQIDRDSTGRAARLTRHYKVDGQFLTLVLEREDAGRLLRVARIQLTNA